MTNDSVTMSQMLKDAGLVEDFTCSRSPSSNGPGEIDVTYKGTLIAWFRRTYSHAAGNDVWALTLRNPLMWTGDTRAAAKRLHEVLGAEWPGEMTDQSSLQYDGPADRACPTIEGAYMIGATLVAKLNGEEIRAESEVRDE